MACRFPGAPNLDAFWRLIREGRSAVGEVPADRWDPDEFYDPTGETPGKMSVRWAALIDAPDRVRSAVLRHHAARSVADGPAAAAAAGSRLGSDGERRPARRSNGRHADRRVRRHRRHRLLEDRRAVRRLLPADRRPHGHRQRAVDRREPALVHFRLPRPERGGRHGLQQLVAGDPLRGREPAAGRIGRGAGRRREHDPHAGDDDRLLEGPDALARRKLPAVRRAARTATFAAKAAAWCS